MINHTALYIKICLRGPGRLRAPRLGMMPRLLPGLLVVLTGCAVSPPAEPNSK